MRATAVTRRRAPADPARAHDADAARESALRLLERTRRSAMDLGRKLRDQGFAPAVVEGVLARLEEVGLVDDVEYARAFLAGRLGRRAAGWRRLEIDLRKRGISAAHAREARARLEERQGATDEIELARRVVTQSAARYAKLDPRVRRQRLWALLQRRGFESDVIERVLS